jgi:chitin disaccharide deacetylase
VRRFVIVTADDFGLHEAINEAVEYASQAGILTAASLMVGAPAAGDAIRRAHRLPNLRVGLHLVLADGIATLAPEMIPAIVGPDGHIKGTMFVNGCRIFAIAAVRRQVENEIRAQFAAFARSGLQLDHVNAHKHFHLHPTILEMILRIGQEFGVSAIRVPDEPLWFAGGGWSSCAGALLLKPWVSVMRARLHAAGMFQNDALFGVGASGAMNEDKLLRIIGRLPGGVSEIYLHPANDIGRALTPSMATYNHAAELAGLVSHRVNQTLAMSDIGRGGYLDAQREFGCAGARREGGFKKG